MVAGLVIGREVVRSNYYVAEYDGTISIMRGVPGSILGLPLQAPYRNGCLNAQNELKLIEPRQPPADCQLFRAGDLKQSERQQVEAGLPTGSEDDAIRQITKLALESVLPVCAPPPPPPAPHISTGPRIVTALPPPPPEPGTNCREVS